MIKIKSLIKKTLFIPKYLSFLPRLNNIRPFFGFVGFKVSGRQKRLSRLVKIFGNFYFNPNILYVGSQWGPLEHSSAIQHKLKTKTPIILNQNGIYYPGWFKGNYKKLNNDLVNINNHSDEVIYQSQFCKNSLEELTGKTIKNGKILYNCTPENLISLKKFNKKLKNSDITCFLGGVFNHDADHILLPALNAIDLLNSNQKNIKYIIKIAGIFTSHAKKQLWYRNVIKKINDLKDKRLCVFIGPYQTKNFQSILEDIDIALHLKYKDPCPNAVIEKIKLGIPHIYSNSGGTPELVRNSGLPLTVKDCWDRQVPVNVDDLCKSIVEMSNNIGIFEKLTFQHAKKNFIWENYLNTHKDLFKKILR